MEMLVNMDYDDFENNRVSRIGFTLVRSWQSQKLSLSSQIQCLASVQICPKLLGLKTWTQTSADCNITMTLHTLPIILIMSDWLSY